ncbi:MAG: hypothetical protein EZS28_035032 [Streblomastix strix]|uniref:Uncharacterized protein n=1 Tax=Streblomastix strix TaxID=222440 RepID=A0A5J4UH79_9EUKA|nr:MAG: hypothetical protein EZS28_035032 [Streblomastix strix]
MQKEKNIWSRFWAWSPRHIETQQERVDNCQNCSRTNNIANNCSQVHQAANNSYLKVNQVSTWKDPGIDRYIKVKNHLSTEKESAEKSHRTEPSIAIQSVNTDTEKSHA